MQIEGTILRGPDFEPITGRVIVDDGTIVAVEELADVESDRIVLPAFVNAHTHVGDAVAVAAGEGLSLEELVAPPDGLKHRILRSTDREELIAGMRDAVATMQRGGTGAFVDFREGGVDGVRALEAAVADSPVAATILGRETVEAMHASDGFGASGANDADFAEERAATRQAGKTFGIHAGEVDASDVEPALDLDPDVLVHMTNATEAHLDAVADADIPVVVCPRCNRVTGVGSPPVEALTERTTVALGTDNVFLVGPSMFREMAATATRYDVTAREVLRMATVNGAHIAGRDCGVVAEGRPARLLVLDGDSPNLRRARDVVRAVVRRASAADVERVLLPDGS